MRKADKWQPPARFNVPTRGWSDKRLRALAYVIGVMLYGDGYTSISLGRRESGNRVEFHGSYNLILTAKSKRFVKVYSQKCSFALGRKETAVIGPNHDGHFTSKYSSVDFLRWWYRQNLSSLKELILSYPVDYLQGRFDSDGYLQDFEAGLCGASGHSALLKFDRLLCHNLGMRVGLITKVGPKPGEPYVIRGHDVKITQQGLRFYVNPRDYAAIIGRFNDEYKEEKLARILASYKGKAWTPWPEKMRQEAKSMEAQGMSSGVIARSLSAKYSTRLPRITVYFWLKRDTSSFEAYDLKRPRNLPDI